MNIIYVAIEIINNIFIKLLIFMFTDLEFFYLLKSYTHYYYIILYIFTFIISLTNNKTKYIIGDIN